MVKRLLILVVALVLFQISEVFSQITIGTVDAGPYGSGSTVTVPINFPNNQSEFGIGNSFTLYISDASGNFAGNGTQIGSFTGFYTPFINGILPALPAGNGYKLRIVASDPAQTIAVPGTIDIRNVTAPTITLTPSNQNRVLGPDHIGWCPAEAINGQSMMVKSNAAAPSSVVITLKNLKTGTSTNFNEIIGTGVDLTGIDLGYYSVTVTSTTNIGGVDVKSIRSYFLHNTPLLVNIQDSGQNIGCINGPGQTARVSFELALAGGIDNNYPGTIYRVDWGDGSTSESTLYDVVNNASRVSHNYTRSSCGEPAIPGNPPILNSFKATINAISLICNFSRPVTAYAQVFINPIARITPVNSVGCINTSIRFTNASIGGTRANCSPIMDYTWYVDGVKVKETSNTDPLDYTFTTKGIHTIRLVASNGVGICLPSEFTTTICIQEPPRPAFDIIGGTTGCAPFTVRVQDKSFIDPGCTPPPNHTYNWIVTNANGVRFTTFTNGIPNPEFNLTEPGVYTIALEITSGSCGVFRTVSPDPIVIINGPAVAVLSPDKKLCTLGTYKFDDAPGTVTTTTLTGTQIPLSDTYTWEVTDIAGTPLTNADYSFEDGTGPNTKYPSINFKRNIAYKITVTHKNTCNPLGVKDSQILEFFPAPQINAGPDQTICFTQNMVQLSAANTGAITNQRWVGGLGTFGDRTNPVTTYIPTAQERTNGLVVLNFTADTQLEAPCSSVTDEVRIIIKKEILITSSPTKSICTDTRANYAPTSNLVNTTYTWTATGSTNASGYANSAAPGILIADLLSNSDPLNNATVTYTITSNNDGCPGETFTLTVTITPKPILTATPAKTTVCSNESTNIALTSNLSGTTYTWTSTPANGVTGNTSNSTPAAITILNDVLINTGTIQGSVTYIITPHSATGCPGTPVTVTINVDPALTVANAGADKSICAASSYTLEGNTATVGTGVWTNTTTSNTTAVTFANPNSPTTTVNGLKPGERYRFTWTISALGACSATTDEVEIIVNEPTVPGTTAGTPTTVCAGTNTGTITLSGHLGSVIRWESSPDGTNWTTITGTNIGTTYSFSNLNATTYYRAIVQNGQCNSMPSTATMITVSPASTVANAGMDQILCNERTAILAGNAPANPGETGLWTIPAGAPSAGITDPTSPTSTVSNLIAGQTYRFVWTITGTGACGPTNDEVIITNNPPLNQSIASTVTIVCNGQEVILNGSVPTGGNGNYTYQWESQVNTDPWRPQLSDGTDKDLVIILNTGGTVSFRRIVTSGGCTDTSNVWTINVRPAIKDNNIVADQIICAGSTPQPLTGIAPTGGDGTFSYQWQSSPDGTTWTDISGANFIDYQPLALTATTYFRRNASTAACGSLAIPSNPVKITVNPNALAEFSWTSDIGCFPFALPVAVVEHPDRNGTYTWFAGTTQIGTGPAFPGYTITGSNQSVTIRLLVTSSLGCTSHEMSHVFSTNQAVPASFTQNTTQGCGPLQVNFVNNSDLNAGATFRWNFGNGQSSNNANPPTITFQPDASGKDTTYVVTLYSITSCGTDSAKVNILVKSPPRPIFSPSTTNGCSPLTVNFSNNSPAQTGITYTFNFGDGTAPVETTDRSTVTHIYRTTTTVRTFNATLTAVNQCGTITTTPYQIIVRPNTVNAQLVVNGPELIGCAPHTVTFDNNTTGATSYTVDFNDGSQPRVSIIAPERFQYTFTNPGTYKVLLTATNGCSTDTTSETIVVRAQPQTDFSALNTLGCTGLAVKFTNTSTGAVSYSWNFGDGSPVSNEFEPTHIYTGTQEYYAVTLTTTNALGCSMTVIKNQFIRIVQPPVAAFNVNPSTLISIPDYTFNFQDESTNNPSIWEWDFGDGTTSSQRNPSHTYLDTGTYKVTLKTTNQQGCFTTTFKNVTIKGVPGYLFVPNAFTPGDTRPELREFRAKGSGILSWRFGVFNKWGQLLWETTKLEEGRPAEGWDGTFKGTAMPQGVYYWKIDVKMVNGSEWKGMTYDSSPPKRTGAIHLIR
ncbi:PKD domain-containing protein [Pedobacter africanus]|uniref:PKD repeat-containing protein n=1 Tax=Pedobacter africanus TaxID=151894 RepID=A0A1W2BJG5_9SPHI|nr:PKD domain-containing protein [Pedobacter africanus]SMC72658.1 PKD repeat-containing protein [Pedobacter africanus]